MKKTTKALHGNERNRQSHQQHLEAGCVRTHLASISIPNMKQMTIFNDLDTIPASVLPSSRKLGKQEIQEITVGGRKSLD